MTMQDPIADMITRIRNGQMARLATVRIPSSKMKLAIAKVLKDEGYIVDYVLEGTEVKPDLKVTLKYFNSKPVIETITRVSRPALRQYTGASEMPVVMDGLGIVIVSTSKGIMTGRNAVAMGQGGEVLCYVA